MVLFINCKGRNDKIVSDTTVVKTDELQERDIEEEIPRTKEKELYPKIACGCHTTIILREDGTVWIWGDNYYGQLGDGTMGNFLPR